MRDKLKELVDRVQKAGRETRSLGSYRPAHIADYTVVEEAINFADGPSLEERIADEIASYEERMLNASDPHSHLLRASLYLVKATICVNQYEDHGPAATPRAAELKREFQEHANEINSLIDYFESWYKQHDEAGREIEGTPCA